MPFLAARAMAANWGSYFLFFRYALPANAPQLIALPYHCLATIHAHQGQITVGKISKAILKYSSIFLFVSTPGFL